MKAVRAVMATQRLEGMGTVIKLLPSVEDLEVKNAEEFSLLLVCDEPIEEIRREILEISELVEVIINPYPDVERVIEGITTSVTAVVEIPVSKPGIEPSGNDNVVSEDIALKPISIPKTVVVPKGTNSAPPTIEVASGEGNTQVHTIRVDTVRMDNLINLVGEMVITRTRLVQIGLDLKAQYSMDNMVNNLNEANVYLGRLMYDLQESVMRLRMVAIGTVFSRFPRLVRDLAKKTGKEMELVLKGEDTELDKTVVEVIGDPLMHLIRNSVDHGIESPEGAWHDYLGSLS
jgi:two-component system chemotaxis sensor kinase CheA